jgi:hypothetical protein
MPEGASQVAGIPMSKQAGGDSRACAGRLPPFLRVRGRSRARLRPRPARRRARVRRGLASAKSDGLRAQNLTHLSCASFVVPGSAVPTPAPAKRVRPYRGPLDPRRRSADRKCQALFRCQPPARNTGQQQCAGREHPAPWHACRSRRLHSWRSWSRSWRSGCCSSARRCACAAAVEAGTVRIVQTRRAGADGRPRLRSCHAWMARTGRGRMGRFPGSNVPRGAAFDSLRLVPAGQSGRDLDQPRGCDSRASNL